MHVSEITYLALEKPGLLPAKPSKMLLKRLRRSSSYDHIYKVCVLSIIGTILVTSLAVESEARKKSKKRGTGRFQSHVTEPSAARRSEVKKIIAETVTAYMLQHGIKNQARVSEAIWYLSGLAQAESHFDGNAVGVEKNGQRNISYFQYFSPTWNSHVNSYLARLSKHGKSAKEMEGVKLSSCLTSIRSLRCQTWMVADYFRKETERLGVGKPGKAQLLTEYFNQGISRSGIRRLVKQTKFMRPWPNTRFPAMARMLGEMNKVLAADPQIKGRSCRLPQKPPVAPKAIQSLIAPAEVLANEEPDSVEPTSTQTPDEDLKKYIEALRERIKG